MRRIVFVGSTKWSVDSGDMSLQAEHCVDILTTLYIELDQRSGWVDRAKLIDFFKQKGVAEGRTDVSLEILDNLKMLDKKDEEAGSFLKMSGYGVAWFEKNFSLISRDPSYEFSLPLFGSVKLVGPNEFYGQKKKSTSLSKGHANWTKWSVFVALVIGAITIAVMKGWL